MPVQHHPAAHPHADHDPALIAAFVDADGTATDLALARDRLATCVACASLAADLAAIRAATSVLPPSPIPTGRAFTIDATRAERLRRGSGWRATLRPFGRDGGIPTRPLATALSTLGLVGLLLSAAPGVLPGQKAAAPESAVDRNTLDLGTEMPGPLAGGGAPDGTDSSGTAYGPAGGSSAPGAPTAVAEAPADVVVPSANQALATPFTAVCLGLLALGLGLFGLRRLAGRSP